MTGSVVQSSLFLVFVLAAGAFTGCLATPDLSQPAHQEPDDATLGGPPWPEPHDYVLSAWLPWDKYSLDVLVLGVKDPVVGEAIRQGILSWDQGIANLAPDLAEKLELRVHWAPDGVPPAGFAHDILFVPQGAFATYADLVARCISTAPIIGEMSSMVHIAAHEFGHCLGLGHVFADGVEYEPRIDIMGSGNLGVRSCPSNLNIAVLRMALDGEEGTLGLPASYYEQAGSC